MSKKILSLALVAWLFGFVALVPAEAKVDPSEEARFAERVKESIQQLGTGEAARVEVRLKDKTKLKGYVAEASDAGFSVVNLKTGVATHVAYPQVQKVKGNNLSTGAKIAIGLSAVVAVLVIWLIMENYG
jgi:preprotein translocase subunit SecF